jgi:hypothetical protein
VPPWKSRPLGCMMLARVPVADTATAELATMVRAAGADDLAARLDQALAVLPTDVVNAADWWPVAD